MPFSFQERVLVGSSASTLSSTKTVRLESLARWEDDAWIHPFLDIDLGLSSIGDGGSGSSYDYYTNRISKVEMSISSHGTQRFPNPSGSGLDDIPVLPLRQKGGDDPECGDSGGSSHEEYLGSSPQGFFVSVRPVGSLTKEEEARAVQAVFEELLRRRLLTTPVTGGEWDVVEDGSHGGGADADSRTTQPLPSPRAYQLILPFDGAAWSSDALAQSFRRTLPRVCGSSGDNDNNNHNKGNDRFFGWSALEWSNFLVGYKDGGGEFGRGDKQSYQYPTYNKLMWWTWASSLPLPNSKRRSGNDQSLSFGIEYETAVPSNKEDWLPDVFLDKQRKCPIGERNAFDVLSLGATGSGKTYRLTRITGNNPNDEDAEENTPIVFSAPKSIYSVGVEQAIRRHHTNQGRFESVIDLSPLLSGQNIDEALPSCRMRYRQVFPNFLAPAWRSLRVVEGSIDDAFAIDGAFYTNSKRLKASLEWNPKDQSSVLKIEAVPGPPGNGTASSSSSPHSPGGVLLLPPRISVSLEYTPSFLTIDDFPGDPNRGRVLAPSRVDLWCDPSTTTVHSNSLLLLPPVPDLSMPFNVISVTSSLYAYIIGVIVTILVRKGSEKIKHKIHPEEKPESNLMKLKESLRGKAWRIKEKLLGKGNGSNANREDEPRK